MTDTEALAVALAGRYRIERELGAGGMATVYLAEDVRHRRQVALKVLHPELSAVLGGERFLKEIELTARLQHPHILPLFDSGDAGGLLFYVMPYVDGETLRARLEREKQLPIADALQIVREVADALQYAHERGVIHRDIKPENILLQGGHALVADFGIALAVQQAGGTRMTQTGLSLGTPQYMAPEQAMGEKVIDARADVYALGAVLYEMLCGDPPFTGSTLQAIVARVMTERPSSLRVARATVPARVERAVMTALEKLPADRWASAKAFAEALVSRAPGGDAGIEPDTVAASHVPKREIAWRRPVVAALVGFVLGATATWLLWNARGVAQPPGTAQRTIAQLSPGPGEYWLRGRNDFALSPDGRTLVVVSSSYPELPGVLIVRSLDRFESTTLSGTEGATMPFWSPDGSSIAFVANGRLKRIDLSTREIRSLCPAGGATGGAWGAGGVILIAFESRTLMRVSSDGGRCEPVSTKVAGVGGDLHPSFFDDGVHYLLSTGREKFIGRVDGDSLQLLLAESWGMAIAAPGNLVLLATLQNEILAREVDVEKGRFVGPSRLVASGVWQPYGRTAVNASRNGTLVIAGPGEIRRKAILVLDRVARTIDSVPVTTQSFTARLSHDGTRLALGGFDVRLFDVRRRTFTELPRASGSDSVLIIERAPVWAPRDSALWMREAYGRRQVRSLSVVGEQWGVDPLTPPGSDNLAQLHDWSSEAGLRVWVVAPDSEHRWQSIWRQDPKTGSTAPLVRESRDVDEPRVSPDGRWLAYTARIETGWEVYLRRLAAGATPIRVSRAGGRHPSWRADSRELIFVTPERGIDAVTVSLGSNSFEPATVFQHPFLATRVSPLSLDESPDGRYLYVLVDTGLGSGFSIVFNWMAGMKTATDRGSDSGIR